MWNILYIILKILNVPYDRNILFLKPLKLCFVLNMQSNEKDYKFFILKMCYRNFIWCSQNKLIFYTQRCEGTAVAQWLWCCATNRKVTGSIPASVSGFFIDIKSFRSRYGPGVDSASNRNEYQKYFLGVKAASA